jgi:primosomal protein N' (replication factor Y)
MTDNRSHLVEVSLFTALKKPLTYGAPSGHADDELLGRRVIVPVGRRRQVGVITSLDTDYAGAVKEVDSFPDLEPILSKAELLFCRFISEYYYTPLGDVIKAFLPAPLTDRLNQTLRVLALDRLQALAGSGDHIASILLERLGRRHSLAAARFADIKTDKLHHLREEGILEFDWEVKESRKFDDDYQVRLTPEAILPARLSQTSKLLLTYLTDRGEVDLGLLRRELKISKATVDRLAQQGLIQLVEKPPFVDMPQQLTDQPLQLNEDQQQAIGAIDAAIQTSGFAPFLLHGVTGSGKTEVYIAAIQSTVALGRSAIMIVPEIGLSQAIYYRLEKVLGTELGLIHSRMSARARLDIWKKARSGRLRIILGPRSAIFSSLPNLGLIVVDEEHDQSLKQASPAPRYHARDLAVYRARQEKCAVILGSATPSVESYYNATSGKYQLLELPYRVDKREMPKVTSVNLLDSFKQKGFAYLTKLMVDRITATLAAGGQVMLLLNRRGFAPSVHCYDCGNKLTCKHCAVSLVYHKGRHRMICHLCGYDEPYPDHCPSCGSNLFLYKGVGTEKLEEELRRHLLGANIIRMDLDSTRRRGSFQDLYHRFKSGKAQILIGTQMIAKGFDFPNVALVGIVSADTALELPDFRARERTFQLLTQASGRAGRLNFPGEVLMQTLHPRDGTIALASKHDFKSFYTREIVDRRELGFPPFTHLILLEVEAPDQEYAEVKAAELRKGLLGLSHRPFTLLGPIPAPILKRRSLFRFHLLLKTGKVKMTLSCLDSVLSRKEFQTSEKLHVIVDVDAVDMM